MASIETGTSVSLRVPHGWLQKGKGIGKIQEQDGKHAQDHGNKEIRVLLN